MTLPNPLRIIHGGLGDDDREPETVSVAAVPATFPIPETRAGTPAVRRWLSEAAGSRHLGGGPDGLAAFLANPRPEPLKTHLRHAGNAFRSRSAPESDSSAAAGKAAFHIAIAIPLKLLAKILRHAAGILDCAADAPHVLILAVVIIAVITAVFLL